MIDKVQRICDETSVSGDVLFSIKDIIRGARGLLGGALLSDITLLWFALSSYIWVLVVKCYTIQGCCTVHNV